MNLPVVKLSKDKLVICPNCGQTSTYSSYTDLTFYENPAGCCWNCALAWTFSKEETMV